MKSLLKNILVAILGSQVRRLRHRHDFKIVGVAGSIGKTSTKLAIARVLQSEMRVHFQEGNYNDIVSVPLVFFGKEMPPLWNPFRWLSIILKNEFQILLPFPFDVVVVELGTDAPGQIAKFRKYLHLDIAVLTAVTEEHMEFFGSLQSVSEEEWSVSFFSDLVYANRDLCKVAPENLIRNKVVYYGKDFGSNYKLKNISKIKDGFSFDVSLEGKNIMSLSHKAVSEIQLYSALAAIAVADAFKINREKIKAAVGAVESFSGRMQKLIGIKNSLIIDDTYNASPKAMQAALDSLYAIEAPQRIAILGMMNELGKISPEAHKKIGEYCDPKLLDLVVTIGDDANNFLAVAAEKRGCRVYKAKDATDAGEFVKKEIKDKAAILAKGSQNGVFAEEAVKVLLADRSEASKLVRQDKAWIKIKALSGIIF